MGWCRDLGCPEGSKAAVGWVRESGLHWQPGAWGGVGEMPVAQAVGAGGPGEQAGEGRPTAALHSPC